MPLQKVSEECAGWQCVCLQSHSIADLWYSKEKQAGDRQR
jgi:hypothetical protein